MDVEYSSSNSRKGRLPKKRKSEAHDTAEPISQSGEQKQPKTLTTLRRKAGKLANLPNLPLDVLFEIFGHLHPHDLLKLARMTKEFRRVLMHPSSVSVWKMALENVPGLPPRPSGMTEVQWANLAFSPHCHFCLASNIRNVEWAFRIRMCGKCAKIQLQECNTYSFPNGFYIDHTVDKPNFEKMIAWRSGKPLQAVCMIEEYNSVQAYYYALKPGPDREAFIKEREATVGEIMKHTWSCRAWTSGQTEDRAKELDQLRDDRRTAIKKKLVELGWEKDLACIRNSFGDHKLVKQPQRLTERVWNNIKVPMLEYMEGIRAERLVRERETLVIDRKQSAVQVLRAYKNAKLPCTELMPESPDFCDFPAVKAILQLPSEVAVNENSFADIIPQLPALFDAWRAAVQREMIGLIKREEKNYRQMKLLGRLSAHTDSDEEEFGTDREELTDERALTKMNLASTVFSCQACGKIDGLLDSDSDDSSVDCNSFTRKALFYPQVIGHSCLTRQLQPWLISGRRIPDSSIHLDRTFRQRRKWRCSFLSVPRRVCNIASDVVKHAGLDPSFATTDDMDNLAMKFACVHCRSIMVDGKARRDKSAKPVAGLLYRVQLFTWREIVQHYVEKISDLGYYLGLEIRAWTREDLDAMLPENIFSKPAAPADCLTDQYWSCIHCRDLPCEKLPVPLDALKFHLLNVHEIPEPIINKDYFKDFAALEVRQNRGSNKLWVVNVVL